jgi:23S rRNA pseudouridine955/2504/2580 synthase/23S rRNA pseudouridine1911/1915/1917 synthase
MRRFEILHQDENFIVIDKTAGLLSIPDRVQSAPSLKDLLQAKFGKIFTVHRLDKDTSGLIVFARNEQAHQFLSAAFENRTVRKIYQGLVAGSPFPAKGTVDAGITENPKKNGLMMVHKKGKPAITDYEALEEFGRCTLMQFRIHTGRTHQIRVHMKFVGHPILCDELYGDGQPVFLSSFKRNFKLSRDEEEERPILHRLALHSHQLAFEDEKGRELAFESPLHKDMKALLQQLRKWKLGSTTH